MGLYSSLYLIRFCLIVSSVIVVVVVVVVGGEGVLVSEGDWTKVLELEATPLYVMDPVEGGLFAPDLKLVRNAMNTLVNAFDAWRKIK